MSSFTSIFSLPSSAQVSTIYAFASRMNFCWRGFIIDAWPRTFTQDQTSEIGVLVAAIAVINIVKGYLFIYLGFLLPFFF